MFMELSLSKDRQTQLIGKAMSTLRPRQFVLKIPAVSADKERVGKDFR